MAFCIASRECACLVYVVVLECLLYLRLLSSGLTEVRCHRCPPVVGLEVGVWMILIRDCCWMRKVGGWRAKIWCEDFDPGQNTKTNDHKPIPRDSNKPRQSGSPLGDHLESRASQQICKLEARKGILERPPNALEPLVVLIAKISSPK